MTSQIILLYLLKTILVSSIFVTYYWFALRNKKFHYYNRFYLLTASVISLIIPLLNFNWFSIEEPVIYGSSEVLQFVLPLATATNSSYQYSWMDYALAISFLVTTALVIILFIQIMKIQILKKKSVVTPMDGFDFINTKEENAPFSFLNNLFWKETISLQDEGGQQIFKHEITHIQQRHTWDRIYCQIVASLFWMNPINWIIHKELMTIHEFIADEEAVGNENVEIFAKMLLQTHYGNHFLNPTHQFFYSSIKRRVIMLTTSKNIKYSYARRVMVLPILVIAVGLVSIKVHATERIVNKVASLKAVVFQVITDTAKPTEKLKLKTIIDTSNFQADTIVIKDDIKKALIIMDGKTVSWEQMKDLKPNDINAINIIKGEKATEYGIEGKNGVILIQSKFIAPPPPPSIAPPPPPSIAPPPPPVEVVSVVGTKGAIINNRGKTPLYVINGLPVQKNSNNPLQNINPNDIESISILKDKSAVSLYGKEGEDGVVLITTKSGVKSGIKSTIKTGYKIDAQEFVNNVPTVVNVANYQKNVTRIKPPQFPGGEEALVKYLEQNLNHKLPQERGGPEGKYTVVLSFLVEEDGTLSNIEARTDPGYGTAEEAIRVIKNGPNWIPSERDGKKGNYLKRMSIEFFVSKK
jgi:TonB-dependent SusC/RagA subfamily outer membrane receptor